MIFGDIENISPVNGEERKNIMARRFGLRRELSDSPHESGRFGAAQVPTRTIEEERALDARLRKIGMELDAERLPSGPERISDEVNHMDMKGILQSDEEFRYQLLDRMRTDCEYYLGYGNRHPKYLWADNEVEHIAAMKALWNSFPEEGKPEWLHYAKILQYEKEMCPKGILVERDYKGQYERFALTPEEFENEFPDTYQNFGPIEESNTDTLRPLVHIWFAPCVVGDETWQRHFSDMEYGLPESDIEAGNLAYVREDMMQSLKKYLPEKEQSLDAKVKAAEAEKKEPVKGCDTREAERY